MKTTFLILVLSQLATLPILAGSETIIRERAKELRNQNNVRQGVPVTPAPPPGQVQPGASVPAAPTPSTAATRLQSGLASIQSSTVPTPAQKQKLIQDLLAVAEGTKPSVQTASNWVEAVSAALVEKQLSPDKRARFVQEIDAILNPAKFPQAKPEGIYADVQAIFQANGLSRTRAVAIADYVKLLAAEARR